MRTRISMSNPLLSLLVLWIVTSPSVRAEDWPEWRGPHRNGISKERGLLTEWPPEGPQLIWRQVDWEVAIPLHR